MYKEDGGAIGRNFYDIPKNDRENKCHDQGLQDEPMRVQIVCL